MSADSDRLVLEFDVGDSSSRQLEEMTSAIRHQLLELDVASVERPPRGPAPDGTRGIDVGAIGSLIVELGKATPVLGLVVDLIRAWAARSPDRTVKLTIGGDTLEIAGLSELDQHIVIRDWMARHPRPTAS